MPSVEENARRIETLSKIARLLGDKIREMTDRIDLLFVEIGKIKETLNEKSTPDTQPIATALVDQNQIKGELKQEPIAAVSTFSAPREDRNVVESSTVPQQELFQEKLTKPATTSSNNTVSLKTNSKTTSDKDKLLEALKIIDDL